MIGVGHYKTTEAVRRHLEDVMETGQVSYGPKTQQLEEEWAAIHGTKHAIAVSSGTAALTVALAALKIKRGWQDGDTVIVPALTFVATVNAVLHNNLIPIFVDVHPKTGLINTLKIYRGALRNNTVAVLPVHLFGQSADMVAICHWADQYGIAVVEDSCEAFGAMHGDKRVGSYGDVGCFSTYVAHHIGAGDGGVATTSDDDLADLIRSLVNHGRDTRYWNTSMQANASPEIMFRFPYVGFNFRTNEWLSAVVLGLMEDWQHNNFRRGIIAEFYKSAFAKNNKIQTTITLSPNVHSWMMFPFIFTPAIDNPQKKFDLMERLKRRGIDSRETLPLLNNPAYNFLRDNREANAKLENHPGAKLWTEAGLYIGCHHYMSMDTAYTVAEIVNEETQR